MSTTGDSTRGKGFLSPCVLLLVQHGPLSIEELCELVTAFGLRRRVGAVETTVERLEADGLIEVTWPHGKDDTWCYGLTARGERWLVAHTEMLAESGRLLSRFMQCYEAASRPATDGEQLGEQQGANEGSHANG